MMHYYVKESTMGTMYSEIKVHSNGTASAYVVLNGNHIYQGDYSSADAAEASFIVRKG